MAPPSKREGRPKVPKGATKHTIPIDDALFAAALDLKKRDRTTLRALVERGLALQVNADTTARTDAILGPLVDQVLQERHRRLEGGLRKLIALIGYEVLRTEYVLLNFITEAGILPSKVETWREQGWQFAVKELRRRITPDHEENGGEG